MSTATALILDNLVLHRGGKRLLGPLSLNLAAGQKGYLAGGNGAGKTTLMETICGFLPTVEGRIQTATPLGYVPQEPLFPLHLHCQDYLTQLFHLGCNRSMNCTQAVQEALHRFQLAAYGKHPIARLSRGWRQRLNLAQAWLGNPQLLLLDEPQTALDPEGMDCLQAAIQQTTAAVLIVAPEKSGCSKLAPLLGTLSVEAPCLI